MPTRQVSFTDTESERAALARRRQLAEHLMAQSQQGIPAEFNRQRITPEYGVGHGLTQLGQALLGRRAEGQVNRREDELNTAERKAYADRLRGMVAPDAQIRLDDVMGGPSETRTVQRRPTPQQEAAIQSVNQLPLEAQQNILGQASVGQLFPKPAEPYTLGPNQRRMGPNNEVLAEGATPAPGESGVTGSLQEIDAINAYNRANGKPEIDPGEYLTGRRGTSGDRQLYADYVRGATSRGETPLPIEDFLVQFRGDVSGSQQGAQERQKQYSALIQEGYDAADSLPVLSRGLELLDSVKTGGLNAAQLAATNLFGVTGADEAELSANLGKAVLSQLRATFGAAFTEREGARLTEIEGSFGKSTEGNRRLLEQTKRIVERAANRGISAATEAGRTFDADEIRKAMGLNLTPPKISTAAEQTTGRPPPPGVDPELWGLMTPEQQALWP